MKIIACCLLLWVSSGLAWAGEPFKEPCEIPAEIRLKALRSESREKWKFGDQVRRQRTLFF